MSGAIFFSITGYLLGSILFAKIFGFLFKKKDITCESGDKNPGTANAFKYGGMLCGVLTLICDLLKGFLPVYIYLHSGMKISDAGLVLVMVSPVLGHILPLFFRFHGGKGIAVSFGCLAGLLPEARPLIILACTFIFLSLIIRIESHYYRTFLTYIISAVLTLFAVPHSPACFGVTIISCLITAKLLMSTEKKENFKVDILWKR